LSPVCIETELPVEDRQLSDLWELRVQLK
jgi:hypothetical protein